MIKSQQGPIDGDTAIKYLQGALIENGLNTSFMPYIITLN